MKRVFLCVALLCFLSTPVGSQARIYGWIDQNGVEHYSTTPPAQEKQTQQKIKKTKSSSSASANQINLTEGQIALIANLQNQGLLSVEPTLNKVLIDPVLWRSMKYSVKEDFAATMAIYCGNKKGTYSYWVEIYDIYSGKKLAKYSQFWGFKIY